MEKQQLLLKKFDLISSQIWQKKIVEELKLNEWNDTLFEAFKETKIAPFYTKSDIAFDENIFSKNIGKNWHTNATINATNIEDDLIKKLILDEGIDSISLKNIDINKTTIHSLLNIQKKHNVLFHLIPEIRQKYDFNKALNLTGTIKGSFIIPLSYFNDTNYLDNYISAISKENLYTIKLFSISAPDSVTDPAEEVSYLLSLAVEILDRLTEKGIPINVAAGLIQFSVNIYNSFFVQLSKLRALRLLWQIIKTKYDKNAESAIFIMSNCTSHKKDYDHNLIAYTCQCIAAICGGTDVITFPEDQNTFYNRLNRNISILLKEESNLQNYIDVAYGAYYPDVISYKISESAWNRFIQIEESGGFFKNIKRG
ncbi:MAG: methylmalonyl-CoA mutase family protein [Cytophagaceae bacterium]